ncbi:VOC family protein [Occultella kanbiaonis]|uniref:VOC family protein n=1 Tax=Occultella kanbiaonis TaxID=2675754 RepID=UPI0012B85EB8|nr:VOC family protein [Occultella kanbiaonis]
MEQDSGSSQDVVTYGTVTPYVVVKDAHAFLDFVIEAFGAVDRGRVPNDDGTVGHGEVAIGDSIVMAFESRAGWPETPAMLSMYVADCDTVTERAVAAGARLVTPLGTNPWGDRGCRLADPFGNLWWIQTHVEDVPEPELYARMATHEFQETMRVSTTTIDAFMRGLGSRRTEARPG